MNVGVQNRFLGTVKSIQSGAVNNEITLEIFGGHTIVAVITHASTLRLGLLPGSAAFALVHASSAMVVAGKVSTGQFSARNCLEGSLLELKTDEVHTEVVIGLKGNVNFVTTVTNNSAESLALEVGAVTSVIFNASSVIVGVMI